MWFVKVSILGGFYKTGCIFFFSVQTVIVLEFCNILIVRSNEKEETIVLVQLEPALTSCSGAADCFVRPSLCHLSEGNSEK